jgi:hypothetical protein
MKWFRQNRVITSYLVGLTLATILSLSFVIHEKKRAGEARARVDWTLHELARLRRVTPFPKEENLRKAVKEAESYRTSLLTLGKELQSRVLPLSPLQPNELQAQLRLAVNAIHERAAAGKVQLPANFNLGFNEYASALPNSEAAPQLGRQLQAIESITRTVIDAHVDSLMSLSRMQLPEERDAATSALSQVHENSARPGRALRRNEKVVESTCIDIAFSGTQAAARRVLNQIAASSDQFYIIRTLVVRNQVDKGPKREPVSAALSPQPAAYTPRASTKKEPAINFIVGTEHLDVAARIEIVRFSFPENGIR